MKLLRLVTMTGVRNLLGHVIAHQLEHLLLRSPQHGDGVMKADWNGRDFEAMRQRQLEFSLAEARRLVSMRFCRSLPRNFRQPDRIRATQQISQLLFYMPTKLAPE